MTRECGEKWYGRYGDAHFLLNLCVGDLNFSCDNGNFRSSVTSASFIVGITKRPGACHMQAGGCLRALNTRYFSGRCLQASGSRHHFLPAPDTPGASEHQISSENQAQNHRVDICLSLLVPLKLERDKSPPCPGPSRLLPGADDGLARASRGNPPQDPRGR